MMQRFARIFLAALSPVWLLGAFWAIQGWVFGLTLTVVFCVSSLAIAAAYCFATDRKVTLRKLIIGITLCCLDLALFVVPFAEHVNTRREIVVGYEKIQRGVYGELETGYRHWSVRVKKPIRVYLKVNGSDLVDLHYLQRLQRRPFKEIEVLRGLRPEYLTLIEALPELEGITLDLTADKPTLDRLIAHLGKRRNLRKVDWNAFEPVEFREADGAIVTHFDDLAFLKPLFEHPTIEHLRVGMLHFRVGKGDSLKLTQVNRRLKHLSIYNIELSFLENNIHWLESLETLHLSRAMAADCMPAIRKCRSLRRVTFGNTWVNPEVEACFKEFGAELRFMDNVNGQPIACVMERGEPVPSSLNEEALQLDNSLWSKQFLY